MDDISYIFEYDCDVTIYSYEIAYQISQEAIKRNKFVNIHIKINIGMNRIGVDPSDFTGLYNRISNLENINIRGVFAHFSAADEVYNDTTANQIKIFRDCIKNIKEINPDIIIHVANSAALMYRSDSHFDMVRVGISLYGYDPVERGNLPSKINLIPIMNLRTFISQLRVVDKNTSISYSNKYLTSRKSIIATIPIGYGDGFRRSPYNFSFVMINKKIAKIVGNVCMDQAMIDVTEIEGLKVGDEVIIMGERNGNNIKAKDIANSIKSSIYELLTSISQRVTRVYYDKL
jgi:alanine racemase